MIKHMNSLTESDKRQFYESAKASFIRHYDMPWEVIEASMKLFIDHVFDDNLFVNMSPDDNLGNMLKYRTNILLCAGSLGYNLINPCMDGM